jgi:hypothetical protein
MNIECWNCSRNLCLPKFDSYYYRCWRLRINVLKGRRASRNDSVCGGALLLLLFAVASQILQAALGPYASSKTIHTIVQYYFHT